MVDWTSTTKHMPPKGEPCLIRASGRDFTVLAKWSGKIWEPPDFAQYGPAYLPHHVTDWAPWNAPPEAHA
jgi:hypothetical protein